MPKMRTPNSPMQIVPGKKPKKIKDNTARLYDTNLLGPYFNGVGGLPLTQAQKMSRTMNAESKRRADNQMNWWNSPEYKKKQGEYSKNVR